MASTVTYEFYSQTYGGGLSEAAFAASLPMADAHVKWLCALRGATTTCNVFKRAVCAAVDAFAEYGEGRVGGFSIGSFSVTNYRDDGTTGAEVAREAALSELAGTGLCWSGVR